MPTKTQAILFLYFLRSTLGSEEIYRETVAKKVAMSTKAKTEVRLEGQDRTNIIVL